MEDEPVIASLVARTLEDEGHRVALAQDGAEALRLAGHGRPTCILLDLHTPVADRTVFLGACRAAPPTPARERAGEARTPAATSLPVPVIVSTTMTGAEAAHEAERLGAAGFLTKPYDLDTLADVVGRVARPS